MFAAAKIGCGRSIRRPSIIEKYKKIFVRRGVMFADIKKNYKKLKKKVRRGFFAAMSFRGVRGKKSAPPPQGSWRNFRAARREIRTADKILSKNYDIFYKFFH